MFVDAQIVNPEMSAIAICQDLLTDPNFPLRDPLGELTHVKLLSRIGEKQAQHFRAYLREQRF